MHAIDCQLTWRKFPLCQLLVGSLLLNLICIVHGCVVERRNVVTTLGLHITNIGVLDVCEKNVSILAALVQLD